MDKASYLCVVRGCDENGSSSDVTFHCFPECSLRQKLWQIISGMDEHTTLFRDMMLCSKHFKQTDFEGSGSTGKVLKSNAMPTLHLPQECNSDALNELRYSICNCTFTDLFHYAESIRNNPRPSSQFDEVPSCARTDSVFSFTKEESLPINEIVKEMCSQYTNDFNEEELAALTEVFSKISVGSCDDHEKIDSEEKANKSKRMSEPGKKTFLDLLCSDVQCKAFTGTTLAVLGHLSEFCEKLNPVPLNSELSMKEGVTMALCRLRLNLSLQSLGDLFGVDQSVCESLFGPTVDLLAAVLNSLVMWPTKKQMLMNMPKCFRNFKDTRVVLHCIEIPADTPNCAKCSLNMFSHSSGEFTVKFLLGMAPSGLFTYCSDAFGGRGSSVKIFEKCDLIKKGLLTSMSDTVMVDEGFEIESFCAKKGIKVHHLPSVSEDPDIIFARAHVDRAFQRIKKHFLLLSGKLSISSIPYTESIMKIAMALINLSPPILALEDF